jgi:small subunit ribosomal protein S16
MEFLSFSRSKWTALPALDKSAFFRYNAPSSKSSHYLLKIFMLCIRLQRIGKKKQPIYRFIVSDKHKDTQANSIEIVGLYNPITQPKQLELKKDRIEYWLSVGAQPSPTVHNILLKEGMVKGKKEKAVFISKKRAAKLEAKKEAKKAAEKAAEKVEAPAAA